jgi:hypothetical protein
MPTFQLPTAQNPNCWDPHPGRGHRLLGRCCWKKRRTAERRHSFRLIIPISKSLLLRGHNDRGYSHIQRSRIEKRNDNCRQSKARATRTRPGRTGAGPRASSGGLAESPVASASLPLAATTAAGMTQGVRRSTNAQRSRAGHPSCVVKPSSGSGRGGIQVVDKDD